MRGIKSLLYNDGYTIRGVQKVIKENGTRQLLELRKENKHFTENKKSNTPSITQNQQNQHNLNESKRKKLMHVLDDLVQLRKKLDTEK